MTQDIGSVVLVGAGPGDPELLTMRAHRAISCADVLVHDRLVASEIVALAPRDALVLDVGKRKGAGCPQREIERLLVHHARRGRRVVRVKGGDPFMFGRGGEEMRACLAAGVPVEVVPGVSSALAAPAWAGIPVTHRGVSAACTIISGHVLSAYDWHALARVPGTLVVLMAASTGADVAARLLGAGRERDTPVAIVHRATTSEGTTCTTTLDRLAQGTIELRAPSVLVIGEVVRLHASPTTACTGRGQLM